MGKGFAVVAAEVRALAQRSAGAARKIKVLVQNSVAQVNAGVDFVGKTGEALGRIAGQVVDINAVVLEIAAAARDQATGLAEINVAVNRMDEATQQNAKVAEQTTVADYTLAQGSTRLATLMDRFSLGPETAGAAPRQTGVMTPAGALQVG